MYYSSWKVVDVSGLYKAQDNKDMTGDNNEAMSNSDIDARICIEEDTRWYDDCDHDNNLRRSLTEYKKKSEA